VGEVVHASACPLDCPDACSLRVTTEHGRLTKVDGDHRNPLTDGFICAKVRGIARHMYGEDRLTRPGIRTGAKGAGEFRWVSWDEALDHVAAGLSAARREHGGEAILPVCYGGSNGVLTQDGVDARLFGRLGASRLAKTLCAAPSGRAAMGLYGKMPGVALPDYVHARLIVLWGFNPSASGIHLVPILRRARQAGARLVVVDPRRTPMAKQADLHLAPRPGTDLPLALAVITELLQTGAADEAFLARHATGVDELRRRAAKWSIEDAARVAEVDPTDLRTLARWWAESSPAVVRCGWGPERNRNGGSAVAAILALPAVAGKFGVRGGGYTMSNSAAMRLGADARPAGDAPAPREINLNQVGRALTELQDPPVTALFSYNCNPLATLPHQTLMRRGLSRPDLFCVVFDQVMTDTARYADVVLPATTFLEHDELAVGYGALTLQRIRPAVAPHGEARPNYAVFGDLIDRLGLAEPDDSCDPDALVAQLLAATPNGAAAAAALEANAVAFPSGDPAPMPMADGRTWTPDGRIHLCPPQLDAEAPHGLYHYEVDPGSERYPLALISPASARTVSSTFGQLHRQRAAVEIHPVDAAARGIDDGDAVRVFNELGELCCHARLDEATRPGVVVVAKGLWRHHTLDGNTANAVCPDTLTDLGGGATFNDARVQIDRLAGGGEA
jgi:anaerobic selenocysteine-containing dehydrogenase